MYSHFPGGGGGERAGDFSSSMQHRYFELPTIQKKKTNLVYLVQHCMFKYCFFSMFLLLIHYKDTSILLWLTSNSAIHIILDDILRFRQTKKLKYKQMEIFINASNIHPQISLMLLNVLPSTINVTFFEDKCFKIKLLMDICTVLCRIQKSIYSLADLNIGHVQS